MDEQKLTYDSTDETQKHINKVKDYLYSAAEELKQRGDVHDASKLENPEKPYFDKLTPKLERLKYGTEEYAQSLKELEVALNHHYEHNSHHPQHYKDGINGMDLFDIVELFFDWKAATERTKDGDIYNSIEINKTRFDISEQLISIFKNTAKNLGY